MSADAWCPGCREWTAVPAGRPCAWCDTPLVSRERGKRHGPRSRITDRQALAIHRKYMDGVSARTLGARLHLTLGYRTAQTCEVAIGYAFRQLDLPVRGRIEATILASTTNGLSPRDDQERRRRRREAGLNVNSGRPLQQRCQGLRTQYPGKGERCRKPSCHGSLYCLAHDPALDPQRLAQLARMRALKTGSRDAVGTPPTGERRSE